MGRGILDLPEVGGLEGLISHPSVTPQLSMLPDLSDASEWIPMLLIPLTAVVVELLSRCRAWRRGVHRAANVLCQGRRARGGGHLVVQWLTMPFVHGRIFGGFGIHHCVPDLDALRRSIPGIAEDSGV